MRHRSPAPFSSFDRVTGPCTTRSCGTTIEQRSVEHGFLRVPATALNTALRLSGDFYFRPSNNTRTFSHSCEQHRTIANEINAQLGRINRVYGRHLLLKSRSKFAKKQLHKIVGCETEILRGGRYVSSIVLVASRSEQLPRENDDTRAGMRALSLFQAIGLPQPLINLRPFNYYAGGRDREVRR